MRSDQVPASILNGNRRLILPAGEPFDVVGPIDLNFLKVDVRGVNVNAVNFTGPGAVIRQIEADITHADGFKFHNGSCNDITLGTLGVPSYIRAGQSPSTAHTDGVQQMHGRNVKYLAFVIDTSLRGNAGILIGRGTTNWPAPSESFCEGCHIIGHSKAMTIAESTHCGCKNTHVYRYDNGSFVAVGLNITAKAVNPWQEGVVTHPQGTFNFADAIADVNDGVPSPPLPDPEPEPEPPGPTCPEQLAAEKAAHAVTKAERDAYSQQTAELSAKISNALDELADVESALTQE